MENDIVTLANAHIDSYAAAATRGRDPTIQINDLAAIYLPHYLPSWTAFSLGSIHRSQSREETTETLKSLLELYRRKGLGTDVRKVKSRVVPISATSALCFITWSLVPPVESSDGKEIEETKNALEFEDVYGFRVAENGSMKGGWEFIVADQETEAVLKRVPDLYK